MCFRVGLKLRLEVRFLDEGGPLFGPVKITNPANPGGPLVEEPIVWGLQPAGTEDRRADLAAQVGVRMFERITQEWVSDQEEPGGRCQVSTEISRNLTIESIHCRSSRRGAVVPAQDTGGGESARGDVGLD